MFAVEGATEVVARGLGEFSQVVEPFGMGIVAGALLEAFFGLDNAVAIEVGTEVSMAVDIADGEFVDQQGDQGANGELLHGSAGVGRFSLVIESADIADPDAVGVVSFAVGTDVVEGATCEDTAFLVDDEMVADVKEVSLLDVPVADVVYGYISVLTGSTAVDNNSIHRTSDWAGLEYRFIWSHKCLFTGSILG